MQSQEFRSKWLLCCLHQLIRCPWYVPRSVDVLHKAEANLYPSRKALAYAIHDLCIHLEYLELLREELKSVAAMGQKTRFERLPLLDSFIKELARMSPLDARMQDLF